MYQREKLDGLMSHRQEFDQETLESFLQMASLIGSMLGPENCPPAKDLIRLFCANSCNSFSITNDEGLEIGVGLFPQLSMMNHSCAPNAILYFNQSQAQVKALRKIEKGEEICISYVDLTLGKKDRRALLRHQYFFDCSCPCCLSKDDPRERLICQNTNCLRKDVPADEPCRGCGKRVPKEIMQSLPLSNTFKDLSKEKLLQKLIYLKSIVSISHSSLLSLRRSLVDRCLEDQDFEKAYIVAQEDLEGIKFIKELQGTTTHTVLLFLLFRLCVERDPVEVSLIESYGLEALKGLEITHGSHHEFCKEIRATLESLRMNILEDDQ